MPANLTPQFHDAEERYKSASTSADKAAALEEMLRAIPKHKGTEKMQADIKRRLARVRKESDKKSGTSSAHPFFHVPREGAGQIVLSGPPNAGKSQLLARLTQAEPRVAEYPFTTSKPLPGMMPYEDVQVQLVDTVPLSPQTCEPWQLAMVRSADAAVLLFDVTDPDLLEQTEFIIETFKEGGIALGEDADPPVFIFGNKADLAGANEEFRAWQELYPHLDLHSFSSLRDGDLGEIRRWLFESLKVVRVYTRAPGGRGSKDEKPFILKRGATILDTAAAIHKDLEARFRSARIWNDRGLDGLMVEKSYQVQDGDLVEIQT